MRRNGRNMEHELVFWPQAWGQDLGSRNLVWVPLVFLQPNLGNLEGVI